MPIYEYRCSSCGHELEALQKFSDAPLAVCPACSQSALVKLVSAGGFQLKGSGWYATDFKGSGSKPAAKPATGETKSEAKSDGKSEASSETKSEAKSETKSETKSEAKATSTPTPAAGSHSAGS